MKRILEFTLALALLIAAFPVIILFSIIIFFETRQFPIFTQLRSITLKHRSLKIYKIRTIKNDFENTLDNNIFLKRHLSKSVTRFGCFLRKTGLDEFPQLINVLKGEMSLVGIRPFTVADLELMKRDFPEFYKEREKLSTKAGITGYWQVFGNRNEGIANLINSEIFYEKNKNIKLDLKILLFTFPIIFFGRHSDAIVFYSNKRIKTIRTILQAQE